MCVNEIKDQIGKEKGGARDIKSKEGGVKGTMVRHWFIGWRGGGLGVDQAERSGTRLRSYAVHTHYTYRIIHRNMDFRFTQPLFRF